MNAITDFFLFFFRPESLGIVVGIVFMVLAILFQYFNFTADSNVSPYLSKVCSSSFGYLLWIFLIIILFYGYKHREDPEVAESFALAITG